MSTFGRFLIFMAGLTLAASTSALANDGPNETQLDAIAAQPGTQIKTTSQNGSKTISITRAQVTTILRQSSDGDWSETSVDNSGHGAVACARLIYVELRAQIDLCQIDDQQALRVDLDSSIAKIGEFIVANSLFPATKEQVDKKAAYHLEHLRAEAEKLSPDTRLERCASSDGRKMLSNLAAQSHAARVKSVDELLSVARPPAANPCL
jgi:hypothetical protein